MNQPDDRSRTNELLTRVAGRDAAALREFYELHAGVVNGVALRLLRDEAAAEDIVQEVFVQVWLQAERFDPARGSARTWVLTITRSRSIDYLRFRAARRECSDNGTADAAPARAAAPEDGMAVGQALSALSRRQRDVIELAYFHGLSHSEIARRLGEPLGTIKTRLRDAMARMRGAVKR